ncbi:ABC-2 transporter permease [Paenibacillus albidus]|uniref:ABC-2 transporter permease n=1 Tax=Paenibacillus albidus TaxID=2041023 RepID=UPI001BE675CA|nr:ABC-2 transporter permease [Paenibacillus albidus]MBT2287802.1 ABC-2 transporter permease [Paenibacillus albidus]
MYPSLQLIRKDFILVRKYLLLLIPYYIWMASMNNDIYIFAALPPMLLLINSCTLDVQHMNQRFLISLPVCRQQLVASKYISMLPFALLGAGFTVIMYMAGLSLGQHADPHFWKGIGLVTAVFPLLGAFYLPVFFWLGQKGSQIVNIIFMMIAILGSSLSTKFLEWFPFLSEWAVDLSSNQTVLYMIGGLAYLCILFGSYLISLRIFIRKDL